MKNKQAMYRKKAPPKLIKNQASSSQSATKFKAFQKASEAVINAVKHLGFTIVKLTTSSSSQTKISTLSRSLSRKLLKKGFWKKNDHPKKIERWKPLIEEIKSDHHQPSNCSHMMMNKDKIIMDSNSFTSERVGVTVGDDCDFMDATTTNTTTSTNSTNSKKSLTNEEEKEQFSPVSVLDCPFDDEDEVSSPFQRRLLHIEGTKQNLIKKLHRFERLAQLEPLNLENRLAFSESDHESIEYAQLHSSESSLESFMLDTEEEEEMPLKLVHLIKAIMPSCSTKLKADNVLVDFLKERLTDGYAQGKDFNGDYGFGNELLSAAKDWINGRYREFSLEWEVQKNRQAFIRDMEERGEWKTLDEEHKEVALELEGEIFASLLSELLDDLLPSLVTL